MFKFNSRKKHISNQEQGTVVVRGKIDGSILHAQKIVIAESGCFNGTIITTSIEVHGVLNGSLETEKLEVFPSGKVDCKNIKYDSITVHNGGFVYGYEGETKKSFAIKEMHKQPMQTCNNKDNENDTGVSKNGNGPTFYSSY